MALRKFLILRRPRKPPSRRTHGADPADHRFLAQLPRFSALRRYGVTWFAGSVLLRVLYDHSLVAVVLTSALLQTAPYPSSSASPRAGADRELEQLQGQRVETLSARGCHSHSHNHSVPIAREMMVSGAPTLK